MNLNFSSTVYDMIIRNDVAFRVNNETRALSFNRYDAVCEISCYSDAVNADNALAELLDRSSNLTL